MQFDPSRSLIDALQDQAARRPDQRMTLYNARLREAGTRDLPGVIDGARQQAGRLSTLGVRPGDRVVLCLANSWDWYDTWLGAVYLGAIPVSASPGFALGSGTHQEDKIFGVAERLDARVVVAGKALMARAEAAPAGTIITTPADLAELEPQRLAAPHHADPDGTAYLQLTSGSTGIPKAAQITHAGFRFNANVILQRAAEGRPGADGPPASSVSWLPLFHDFGLVLTVGALLNGLALHVYPPQAFLSRPIEWLRRLGQQDRVINGQPNFALQHAQDRLTEADLETLDLSNWHTCLLGAEMNRAPTLQGFIDRFAPAGLDPATLAPAYGMAEATLVVSMVRDRGTVATARADGADSQSVVTCGVAVEQTEIRIVDQAGAAIPDGRIGHVQARTPSLLSGYWEDPAATAAALKDGWLITGDLGFLRDGELFLTGRTKDILIINGTNYMPHELELLAEGVSGASGMARAVAFSVDKDGTGEVAVLTVEIDRGDAASDLHALGTEIIARIGQEMGIPIEEVQFLSRGAIPRTTSGKIQRGALREAYLQAALSPIASVP